MYVYIYIYICWKILYKLWKTDYFWNDISKYSIYIYISIYPYYMYNIIKFDVKVKMEQYTCWKKFGYIVEKWLFIVHHIEPLLVRTRVTSPPNWTPRRFPYYLLLYFLFIFYFPRCIYLTGFSFCFFPGFLVIFILLSSNSNRMSF